VALSEIDRRLLQRCLAGEPRSWEEFVDRFVGLVLHVIDHTAQARGTSLAAEDREDLVAEVFLAIVRQDFRVLRRFRGESSLATYLTVIARRVVIGQLAARPAPVTLDSYRQAPRQTTAGERGTAVETRPEQRISDQDEVARLLARLDGREAEVVRMYHLEGRTYREISAKVGMPENTIGPTLSRARSKLREARADSV
jgi:RNA polymerase sigma-70 factor (ECF subfamily)